MSDWLDVPDPHLDPTVAAHYDDSHPAEFEAGFVDAAASVLTELAGDGAAVEFAIGTGRIALPLAARGVAVHGLDISEPMLEQLRAKPGAGRIRPGLELEHRWADWRRTPFTGDSPGHVSIWRKPMNRGTAR